MRQYHTTNGWICSNCGASVPHGALHACGPNPYPMEDLGDWFKPEIFSAHRRITDLENRVAELERIIKDLSLPAPSGDPSHVEADHDM